MSIIHQLANEIKDIELNHYKCKYIVSNDTFNINIRTLVQLCTM